MVTGYVLPATAGSMQPWNGVVFPSAESNRQLLMGMSARIAKSIPAFGRGLDLIVGMCVQMPLDDVRMRDTVVLDRPRLLEQPDPDVSRAWFVSMQVEDYLIHGNAVALVTSRDAFTGYPLSVVWVPAAWVTVAREPATDRSPARTSYWVGGRELPAGDVIHIRRGADPDFPYRGIGVIEQYTAPLSRIRDQETYENTVLNEASVPSVVLVSGNPDLDQDEADEAKDAWETKFSGPHRRPAVLPNGSDVKVLSWSPHDTELQDAKKASLQDVANMLNLDGYWLGAPAAGLTYRTPGPLYLNLLRQTVNPILEPFEQQWSAAWLPRGRRVRFDRRPVLLDDAQTNAANAASMLTAGIITLAEARQLVGYSADVPDELTQKAKTALQAQANPPAPTTDGGQQPADDGEDTGA